MKISVTHFTFARTQAPILLGGFGLLTDKAPELRATGAHRMDRPRGRGASGGGPGENDLARTGRRRARRPHVRKRIWMGHGRRDQQRARALIANEITDLRGAQRGLRLAPISSVTLDKLSPPQPLQ